MRMTSCADQVSVPDMVRRGLNRVEVLRARALAALDSPEHPRAVLLARVAELYRREARWWNVLTTWAYSPASRSLPEVFGHAAILARSRNLGFAEHYDELAASARRRTALDPVLGVVA